MEPIREISDPRLAKALAHPLRVAIMTALEDRTASPSELEAELPASLGTVSYHVRKLARLGLIELVGEARRRGAVEHYYRATPRVPITDEAWAQIPVAVKRELAQRVLEEIGRYVEENGATLNHRSRERDAPNSPLSADAERWRRTLDLLRTLVDRALATDEESQPR